MTIAGLLVGLLACSRPPPPSPEYERARQLWTNVVKERGVDAGDDPRAEQVLSLLDRVPKESEDAAAAADIRSRISALRTATAAERDQRARMLADLDRRTDASAQTSGAGPASAADRAAAPSLRPGTKLDEFRKTYGECAQAKGPVKLDAADGSARDGEMWVIKADDACRADHPELTGRAAVFVGGALASVSPLSSMRQVEVRRQIELAPLPGGGQGMVVDGKVVPLPAGARIVEGEAAKGAAAAGLRKSAEQTSPGGGEPKPGSSPVGSDRAGADGATSAKPAAASGASGSAAGAAPVGGAGSER